MVNDTRTVRVVRVIGGARKEVEISSTRARELGIGTNGRRPPTVAYLMDGLVAWQEAEPSVQATCPQCGTSHRELILRHTAGCAACFDTFSGSIERLLSTAALSPVHQGRIPARLQRYRTLFVERETLLHRLTVAIESEDFEAAADLRDRLRSITDDGSASV
jgi:protein arginine kinase activator